MLVEDAQHADESLLGFFEHLIDWARDLPIFVVVFARPGLPVIDSGYGMGRNRSTLSLDPLDDASMAALVEALVPGMPPQARDTITARAEGIALFAVETVRSLIDHGIVRRDEGTYRLVGGLGELSVPGSLHALLAGRLDAVAPQVRSLVADASVLGTSFPKDALVAVSGKDAGLVQAALSELVKRDVLQVFADPLSPERGAYRFSQEMLRQVAYETLSKKDRKSRHISVARHLRATFANDGEEVADAVARHYLDALASGPHDPDAEEVSAQALEFLVKAAERAGRSGAPAQAAKSYAEAAAIAPTAQATSLFERASQASNEFGDYEAAIAYADAARERHLVLSDVRGAARAQSMKGHALRRSGRHSAARAELTEALEVLRADPDQDTVIALDNLAALEIFSGNLADGERLSTEALALGQALDVGDRHLALCFITKGIAAALTDRMVEAAAHYETATRLAERAGDYGDLARAQLNLADVLPRTGDLRGAVEAARSAAAHARRTGRRDVLAFAVTNLAVALLELGEWDEADAMLAEALEVEHLEHEVVHCYVGWLGGLRGDGERAARAVELVPRLRQSEEPQTQAVVGVLEALVALSAGDSTAPSPTPWAFWGQRRRSVSGTRLSAGPGPWPHGRPDTSGTKRPSPRSRPCSTPTRSVTSRPSSEPSGNSLARSLRPTPTHQARWPSWPTPSPRCGRHATPTSSPTASSTTPRCSCGKGQTGPTPSLRLDRSPKVSAVVRLSNVPTRTRPWHALIQKTDSRQLSTGSPTATRPSRSITTDPQPRRR